MLTKIRSIKKKLLYIASSLLFGLILFLLASAKHFLLGNDIADIGFFEQFSWLIANADINSISSLANRAPLQDHFSLLLIAIAGIYKIFPSSYTLLALQSLALGSLPTLGAYLAIKRSAATKLVIALTIAIALCPYLFLVNLANFHPEVITAPLMLITIIESTKKRRIIYYSCLILSLFAKKAQVLFGLGVSIYAFAKGNKKRGLTTIVISIAWWIISAKLSEASGDFINMRLGYLGESKIEIIRTLFTSPWSIFREAPPESIILYSVGLISPFLLFINKNSFPALLGTLPIYFTNIISSSGMQRELDTHYSIAIFPFLIICCLDTIENWKDLPKSAVNRVYSLTIGLTVISFLGYARIGYFKSRYLPRYNEAIEFRRVINSIPANSSVLTSDNYVSHLANRRSINTIESNHLGIYTYDYIVLPQSTNQARINGRLKLVKGTNLESQINSTITQARSLGMNCSSSNQYIRVCQKK